MTVAVEEKQLTCPRCNQPVEMSEQGSSPCPLCSEYGYQVYIFNPPARQIDQTMIAMGDMAACVNHPDKKADHICAGTGDYICPLCSVEVAGKTYSVQYVDRVGIGQISSDVQPTIKRPDKAIGLCFVLSFLLNGLGIVATICFVLALIYYIRMLRLRKNNDFYYKLVGKGQVIINTILLMLTGLLMIGGLALLVAVSLNAFD